LASHVLALTLMFELRPPPPHPPMFMGDPPPLPRPPLLHPGMLLDIGVRLGALMLAAWIGARWLSQPIRQLASAARGLGKDIHQPPLPEDGTVECREASRVFNQMQARIRQQIDERDRFVAAVSHDLRTPLTRLRLRAEGLSDADEQQRFSQDIHEMDAMISATLDYLRGAADAEALVSLDMQALVFTIADDRQACGQAVRAEGQARPLRAQASALRRCINNLVDNAVRYGDEALIRLVDAPDRLCIEISDRGPGIPEDELTRCWRRSTGWKVHATAAPAVSAWGCPSRMTSHTGTGDG
jgi:signal transduction histidine kinase